MNLNIPIPSYKPHQNAAFPATVAERARSIDPTHFPNTVRKRMGFTGFAPALEPLFNDYYDTRFRSWLRAGLGIMGLYYAFRWYVLFINNPDNSLEWMFATLTIAWTVLYGLSYSVIPFRLLQWLSVPVLMLMLWSIVALNHGAWQNGNDQIGAAQVMSPFVIGLGLLRFPLRMGMMALTILLGTLVVAYMGYGVPLFPEAAGLVAITVGVLILFYTTLEREARLDFITRLTLYHLATTDGLTGIANRTYFIEHLGQALKTGEPVTLLVFDVDRFKQVNDTYGHAAGDAALATIGKILAHSVKARGLAGRLGGEEFGVLLKGCPVQADTLAKHITATIRTTLIPYAHGSFRVTVSGGIVTSTSPHLYTVDKLLHCADHLMYQAKHEGRNRVMQG